jgi:NADP-dependent 3-hydroxy acid dehydrogenase YdfG
MKVQNKVIVVTGAGSGMGRELTLNLLGKGAKVAAIDINKQSLQETSRLAGDRASDLCLFVTDITDRSAVESLLGRVLDKFSCVDGIINNAGIIQPFVKLIDLNYETIDRVLNVNFYGTLYMIKTFLPVLLNRPEAHIVNISSMGGFLPVPGQTIYGASKAAIKLMTEGLNSELAKTNVRVTVVFPGGVNTNIMTNSGLPDIMGAASAKGASNILSAEKAASIIIDGMQKNRYRVLAGKDSRLMDILYRLNPKTAARLIAKAMGNLLAK